MTTNLDFPSARLRRHRERCWCYWRWVSKAEPNQICFSFSSTFFFSFFFSLRSLFPRTLAVDVVVVVFVFSFSTPAFFFFSLGEFLTPSFSLNPLKILYRLFFLSVNSQKIHKRINGVIAFEIFLSTINANLFLRRRVNACKTRVKRM